MQEIRGGGGGWYRTSMIGVVLDEPMRISGIRSCLISEEIIVFCEARLFSSKKKQAEVSMLSLTQATRVVIMGLDGMDDLLCFRIDCWVIPRVGDPPGRCAKAQSALLASRWRA